MIQDFLTFKIFISSSVLTIFYIFGAFTMPFIAWVMAIRLKKYMPSEIKKFSNKVFLKIKLRDKLLMIGFVLFILLSMEICWRMMFEFLIAYMQIRDVLVGN